MKIIPISGKARSGKDCTAQIISKQLTAKGYKVLIAHYGDLVKYICKMFFGWDGNKDEKGRTLLQFVGTDRVRSAYPEFWVDFIEDILTFFPNEWDYVLIPDARFPNEINRLKENGWECISLRVNRNVENNLTTEQKNHPSETALDNFEFNYVISNNGDYNSLNQKVNIFIDWLSKN
jgi:hypothetical protein